MWNADLVRSVELEPVHTLDTVCLVGEIGPTDIVYYTHGTVGDLVLTVCDVVPRGETSLLIVGIHCQIKAHQTLVTNVVLVTHVTVLNVAAYWHALARPVCSISWQTLGAN